MGSVFETAFGSACVSVFDWCSESVKESASDSATQMQYGSASACETASGSLTWFACWSEFGSEFESVSVFASGSVSAF
jgi:hypothetical protein